MPSDLLVADDVLGGFFAINGGAFAGEAGNVFYYAPGSGEWEDCENGVFAVCLLALCGVRRNFTSRLDGMLARGCCELEPR